MIVQLEALKAPTEDTLDEWLATPRPARCGEPFTPSKPMWNPDKLAQGAVNWQAAQVSVSSDWQRWLHAALAYRMSELTQGTLMALASVLSRAGQLGLNIMNENHLIDLRERFSNSEFGALVSFIVFWQGCESLEKRPSLALAVAYAELPRKKKSTNDPVLSLDPEKGPFTQAEQDALYQWLHERFCHHALDPEHYLYLRLLMIYGQRGIQMRMMVFDDFIQSEQGCKVKLFWAKQKDNNDVGFRAKSELFVLSEDLYELIQHYKAIILARLKREYPDRADWDKAIKYVPLFRRKFEGRLSFGIDINTNPVLLDSPNMKTLEDSPHASFHVPFGGVKSWLSRIERMPGFPVSPRTHQPLKISSSHRFRYTLGTDLSNAGLDEWAIAKALMHKYIYTVRRYRAVSAELMELIDEKMSDHLALVVSAFSGSIVRDRASAVNGHLVDRQIENLAVCGANTVCHLDAPFSCYACPKFQPLLDADHRASLERMERRRAQTLPVDKTTGVVWDRAILACRKVILDCKVLHETAKRGGGE